MSGSIIGAIAGATIGFFLGGPIGAMYGWSIGGVAGSLLFPEQVEGPRLQDLRPQTSEYGRPIPITFGTIALSGNVIWASDLIEVQREEGGKGGPEVLTHSYYANFAVAICEGEVQLGRIWAGPDKRLIWDGTALEGADQGAQLRFYAGSEDQLPDPLIESYMGVGTTPAYRGAAYVVLEHFPVEKDGNRIPFLTIEVGNVEAEMAPLNLGWSARIDTAHIWGDKYVVTYWSLQSRGIIVRNLDDYSFVDHFRYDLEDWIGSGDLGTHYRFFDADRGRLIGAGTQTGPFTVYDLADDGARTEYTYTSAEGGDAGAGGFVRGGCYHNGRYIFAANDNRALSPNKAKVTLWIYDSDTMEPAATYVGYLPDGHIFNGEVLAPHDSREFIYGFSTSSAGVTAWAIPLQSAFTPVSLGLAAGTANFNFKVNAAVDPNTGYIWSAYQDDRGDPVTVRVNNPDTQGQIFSHVFTAAATEIDTGFLFAPTQVSIWGAAMTNPPTDAVFRFTPDPPAFESSETSLEPVWTKTINQALWNPVLQEEMFFRYGGWQTTGVDFYVFDPDRNLGLDEQPDNVYLGDRDARVEQEGESLASIISKLSVRAGLTSERIDVSQLEDDMVDGYAIASQMDVRAAIMALQPAYFFDAVESGGVVKYVKRGGEIAETIPDADLGAYESGAEPVDPLTTVRMMDEEMPSTVTVRYILEATNYDTAAKIAKRLVGNSGNEAALDLPIVMTDTKGQEVADVNLHMPWVARRTYQFSLPRKYAYLEPTDIVVVKNQTMRIVKIKQTGGRYQVEAVHDDANLYVPNVVVTETQPPPPGAGGGGGGGGGVGQVTGVVLELM